MTYTAIIAEDEPLLRTELAQRISEAWPELKIVAVVEDGASALEEIAQHRPQVAFLDIRMPGMTGLDVAASLADCSPDTHVVFVTAYQQYAVDAFEAGAIDYLLKPVQAERLQATVARVRKHLESAPAANNPSLGKLAELITRIAAEEPSAKPRAPLTWITAGAGRDTRLIMVDDIAYFKADNKYTVVMTASGEALIRKPIKELLDELDPQFFKQVHRATIVNLRAIRSITRDDTGKGLIQLKARPETLQISQPFMHLFRSM